MRGRRAAVRGRARGRVRPVAGVPQLLEGHGAPGRVQRSPATSSICCRRARPDFLDGILTQAADPQRLFLTDLCWSNGLACAGDVRLNDWKAKGYGKVEPVLFTARNGATLSGHVWKTLKGPTKRPGVVITNGSVQAPEQAYWWAAQTLAKAGYVVMTWDPQNQGRSDTLGQGEDALSGALSQVNGETFYDGTQDALDFFLSTKKVRYLPACQPDRDLPLRQAGAPRPRRAQLGLQPLRAQRRSQAPRPGRALVRRRRRLLHEPGGPAGRCRGGLGQPLQRHRHLQCR